MRGSSGTHHFGDGDGMDVIGVRLLQPEADTTATEPSSESQRHYEDIHHHQRDHDVHHEALELDIDEEVQQQQRQANA